MGMRWAGLPADPVTPFVHFSSGINFMKSVLGIAVLVFAALFQGPAMARGSVPVVNYENVVVTTGSGKPATAEQVRQAFISGTAGRGWTYTQAGEGKLLANLVVRNKHTVSAEIVYSGDKFSVTYYELKDGKPVIHPNYNNWVTNMLSDVRVELSRL
jgi:hypothetical protein